MANGPALYVFPKGFRFKPLAESLCLRASLILRPTLEMLNG